MLDYLISASPDVDCRFFTAEFLPTNSGLGYPQGEEAINFLLNDGFLSANPNGDIKLELRGRCYKELIRLEAKEKWKERLYGFVFGVFLTVLTGFITKWLG